MLWQAASVENGGTLTWYFTFLSVGRAMAAGSALDQKLCGGGVALAAAEPEGPVQ